MVFVVVVIVVGPLTANNITKHRYEVIEAARAGAGAGEGTDRCSRKLSSETHARTRSSSR